jgi:hypothetical protein
MSLFPVNALVDNLNLITENVVVTTSENLNHPTPIYVQTIIFELLKQVGFSRFKNIFCL